MLALFRPQPVGPLALAVAALPDLPPSPHRAGAAGEEKKEQTPAGEKEQPRETKGWSRRMQGVRGCVGKELCRGGPLGSHRLQEVAWGQVHKEPAQPERDPMQVVPWASGCVQRDEASAQANGFGSVVQSLFILQTESWLRGTYTWALRSVLLCNSPWSRSEKSCRTQAGTRSALGRGHVLGEQWLCDGCSTGLEQRGAPAAGLGDRLSSRARVKRDHLQECVWLETTTLPEKFLCSRGCCLAVWQKGAVSNNATKQCALQLPPCLQDRCELFLLGPGR